MDNLDHYRKTIRKVILNYTKIPYSHGEVDFQPVFDATNDHYLLMLVGRDGFKRVHGALLHLDIINGKIWIQRDGTENGIATDLLAAGIPKDKIVLAFYSKKIRQHSEFAIN